MHPKYLIYDRPNAITFEKIKNPIFQLLWSHVRNSPYRHADREIGGVVFNPTHEMLEAVIAKAIKYGFRK
jgi:hypothetical protein